MKNRNGFAAVALLAALACCPLPAAAQAAEDAPAEPPPRRVVLCLDGTWQSTYVRRQREGGDEVLKPTNVLKTCRSVFSWAPAGEREQLVYYDPGVGAASNFPGTSNRILHFADRTLGGAWGAGFEGKVENALTFLVHNLRDGDEVFVFGFSRGAAEARAVTRFLAWAGGLPVREDAYYLPIFYREYLASHGERPAAEVRAGIDARHAESERLEEFRPVDVVFLGVWDTVMSLGSRFKSRRDTSTASRSFHVGAEPAAGVRHARQALAIDEARFDFRPEIWSGAGAAQTLEQRWFAGDHSNVGGGYVDDGLANVAFHWLLTEAAELGLEIDDDFAGHYRAFPFDRLYVQRSPLLRLLDKLRGTSGRGVRSLVGRPVTANLTLDPAVIHRLRAAPGEFEEMGERPYRPENVLRYLACVDDLDAHFAAIGLAPRHRELPEDVTARLAELAADCRPGDVPPLPAAAQMEGP